MSIVMILMMAKMIYYNPSVDEGWTWLGLIDSHRADAPQLILTILDTYHTHHTHHTAYSPYWILTEILMYVLILIHVYCILSTFYLPNPFRPSENNIKAFKFRNVIEYFVVVTKYI